MNQDGQAAQPQESHYVLGETLRPMLTNAMGSAIEIFDTKGIPGGGPPPHTHAWEEIYVVLSGEMDVSVDGKTRRLGPGGYAHVPANTPHAYKTLDNTHFLTIVSAATRRNSSSRSRPKSRWIRPTFLASCGSALRTGLRFSHEGCA